MKLKKLTTEDIWGKNVCRWNFLFFLCSKKIERNEGRKSFDAKLPLGKIGKIFYAPDNSRKR